MPAHVTLLGPFVHGAALRPDDLEVVSRLLGRFEPFEVRLASFGRFDEIGVLYLAPHPSEPFAAMSRALWDEYPQVRFLPPWATEIVPHVTVASRLAAAELDAIEAEVGTALPLVEPVRAAVFFERGGDGRFVLRAEFPLGT